MGVWGLIQIVFDIFLALGLGVCVLRVSRRPQDDPRLSRALQLLQSKISVLEDLSDRVEAQAARVTELLTQKDHEMQDKIEAADSRIQSLRDAVDQGIETVRLAQSSLKAEDILEKKSSAKYAQAARMAHEGKSVEAISRDLGLPRTEVEFISKVNRETLRTTEAPVPASPAAVNTAAAPAENDFSQIFEIPTFETSTSPLSRLGEEFRRATQYAEIADESPLMAPQVAVPPVPHLVPPAPVVEAQPPAPQPPQVMPQSFVSSKAGSAHLQRMSNAAPVVRKVEFPRIDSNR